MDETLQQYPYFSDYSIELMKSRGILEAGETVEDMIERVSITLAEPESKYRLTLPEEHYEFLNDPSRLDQTPFKTRLATSMRERKIMFGSPILSNAGRINRLFSAVAFPVSLIDRDEAKRIFQVYVRGNSGIGFDLTGSKDPVSDLFWLDSLAEEEEANGTVKRPISLMGSIFFDSDHLKTFEFIDAKKGPHVLKHFNISVLIPKIRAPYNMDSLRNGSHMSNVIIAIMNNAWLNGEPGIIFIDDFNNKNPMDIMAEYSTSAPCADIGFQKGSCGHFGYINLAEFTDGISVDYGSIQKSATLLTRALDNAVSISEGNHPYGAGNMLLRWQRKISIGTCGLADLFLKLNLSYGSEESIKIAKNIFSVINYASKWESIRLAYERGSCEAMKLFHGTSTLKGPLQDGTYIDLDLFKVIGRYINLPTGEVRSDMWEKTYFIAEEVNLLRNLCTTSQSPTSIISQICETSPAIDPLPGIYLGDNKTIRPVLVEFIEKHYPADARSIIAQAEADGTFQYIPQISMNDRAKLRLGEEVSVEDQIRVDSYITQHLDDAISKTIITPYNTTPEEFLNIFLMVCNSSVTGATFFRIGSRQ